MMSAEIAPCGFWNSRVAISRLKFMPSRSGEGINFIRLLPTVDKFQKLHGAISSFSIPQDQLYNHSDYSYCNSCA